MLSNPPRLPYCGLTIILSNPSRLDKQQLLSGTGGIYFNNECLSPELNRYQCDIRLVDDPRPLLPNTKALLVLGEAALKALTKNPEAQLNAQRGNINYATIDGNTYILICSYLPQEAVDMKDYESTHNLLLSNREDSEEQEGDEKKKYGKTSQKNYRFWLKQDTHKCIAILRNGGKIVADGWPAFNYHIRPDIDLIIYLLRKHKGCFEYFDMETNANLEMICFSFSFDDSPDVYVVPLIRHDYTLTYGEQTPEILTALAISHRDNTVVAHNGYGFDLFVLAYKYHIPFQRVYDTMLAQSRIYPECEKSLGHCISLRWMMEPFHKDEANFSYNNEYQERQLLLYCGKDVSTLKKLHKAQLTYASKIPGLTDSIMEVNSYVRAYLTTTLMGIRYDESIVEAIFKENDRLMNHYVKMLDIMIGSANLKLIRGSGKSDLPSSPKQCVTYFHEMLNYPVVSKTDIGNPSLAADAMFKLKLKMTNPVIDVILAYRAKGKESGSLKFKPWRIDKTKQKQPILDI